MGNSKKLQVIYLPSSGGYTSSRIAPEPVTRRRFPLQRYSVQEDGSLVVRSKHANRDDVRPRPYTKSTVRFDSPSRSGASLPPEPESTSVRPTLNSDPTPTVELLKTLVPALLDNPNSFEESISSICAAHDLDRSAISAVTQAVKRRPIERTRTLDRSTPPAAIPPSSTSTSSLSPIKQERPFPSGSPGTTAWYSSHSLATLREPPPGLGPNVGDLYVHNNRAEASYEVWLYVVGRSWLRVDATDKVYHPTIAERVLSMRANGTPSWITAASYTTIKGRKEKAKATE